MPPLSPLFLSFGLCLAGSGALAAVSLDGLATDSPFVLKEASTGAPVVTENATVEFRGMIATKDGTFFGLYDRTKQIGSWVRKDDKGADFKVQSYDVATDTVSVEYQGQKFNLPLSSSKIALAAAAPVVNLNPPMGGNGTPVNAQPAVNRADDQRRLESVATEVRRRRALRQAGAANPGAAVPANGTRP